MKKTISDLLHVNGGYVTTSQLITEDIPSVYLTRAVKTKQLRKVNRGFYASFSWLEDDFLLFQYRFPQYIFSYQSALFLHHLTDQIPSSMEVTAPNGYHPREVPLSATIHYLRKIDLYKLGITEVETPSGNRVKAYDPERTLCDLIAHREEVPTEVFVKAINRYRKSRSQSMDKLLAYAKVMRIDYQVMALFEVFQNDD